jgi:hypothetical protein
MLKVARRPPADVVGLCRAFRDVDYACDALTAVLAWENYSQDSGSDWTPSQRIEIRSWDFWWVSMLSLFRDHPHPLLSSPCKGAEMISFDFDGTLIKTRFSEDHGMVPDGPNCSILEHLLQALDQGAAVGTSRWEGREKDQRVRVRSFLGEWGLHNVPVHFTNGRPKVETLVKIGSIRHFDDDVEELLVLPPTIKRELVRTE